MIIPGGSLLLHIGKPLGVGRSWLLPHGLLSVRRHERLGSVAVGLYRGEIHRYLSSYEGSGEHYYYLTEYHAPVLKYVCTMGRARRIISCCWLFCLCYSSPWLMLTQIKYSCVKGIGLVRSGSPAK